MVNDALIDEGICPHCRGPLLVRYGPGGSDEFYSIDPGPCDHCGWDPDNQEEPMTTKDPAKDEAFDPSKYIVKLRGKAYIEVKWRLVWFRTAHPNGTIRTEILEHNRVMAEITPQPTKQVPDPKPIRKLDPVMTYATFKAEVLIEDPLNPDQSLLIGTGYGQEESGDFSDYYEKAETKAIGRALAAAGFGTQFCEDLSFATEESPEAVVDSPIQPFTF